MTYCFPLKNTPSRYMLDLVKEITKFLFKEITNICKFIILLAEFFMTNLISLLPNELIVKINTYFDPKTREVFSMLDRRIKAAIFDAVKCIRIFPPNCQRSAMPEDILIKVIRRYPNLKKIIFGPLKNMCGISEFSSKEAPYLKSLISYLKSDRNERLLNSIKKIQFTEITRDIFSSYDIEKVKELNNIFLSSIGHKNLETITIQGNHIGSILTGVGIQSILENSPNLRNFEFKCNEPNQGIALSFSNQSKLSKVKLLNWKGPSSTIESLRNCKELKELVINYRAVDEIRKKLLKDHSWNLKHLALRGVALGDDDELSAITKMLPNLECLDVGLHDISDKGMEKLGKNCPNLKILKFSNKNLTNLGLDQLTRHLLHLEIISFNLAFNITEEGIASIAQNCKNLRFLQIIHCKKVEKSGIDALINNCPNLKVVGFSHSGPISLEDMYHLVEHMPRLRYVDFYYVDKIQEGEIEEFYQKFPKISKIPFTLNVKELRKLIV